MIPDCFYVDKVNIIYSVKRKVYFAAVWWNCEGRTILIDVPDYRKLRFLLLKKFDIKIPNKDKLVFCPNSYWPKNSYKMAVYHLEKPIYFENLQDYPKESYWLSHV